MNKIQKEDIRDFAAAFALKDCLRGSKILITGSTGLIGSSLVHCLLALDAGITVYAPVRKMDKVKDIYEKSERERITFIECDMESSVDYGIPPVDYIIHCAAPTASKYFVEHPVETFNAVFHISESILRYGIACRPKGIVFLSSLEVYGCIGDDSVAVDENVQGNLELLSVRSSYPMAKRAVEHLCHLYAVQYGLNVKVARLTQVAGAGVSKDDNRVMAQFCRLASKNEDIVLHSIGQSARPYCYTTDCVSAILYILLKGKSGESYNVATESTYISALGMAEFIRDRLNPAINVRCEPKDGMGYAPDTKVRLSAEKLRNLGWKPDYDLGKMLDRIIKSMNADER